MTSLSVSHNIFLTRGQRYALYKGTPIECIGVSVPVWFHKGKTSEPANEVFCKYKILSKQQKIFIKHIEDGYELVLPPDPNDKKGDDGPCLKDLLDLKDGGNSWFAFRQDSKVKHQGVFLRISYFVEIRDVSALEETLVL